MKIWDKHPNTPDPYEGVSDESILAGFIGKDVWVLCSISEYTEAWCRILEKLSSGEYKVNCVYDDEIDYNSGKFEVSLEDYEVFSDPDEWTTEFLSPIIPLETKTTDELFEVVDGMENRYYG